MSVYENITKKIVTAIESGAATGSGWKMPWHGSLGMPENATTGRSYSGVNVVNLWIEGQARGFSSSGWATFKQWQGVGAKVKKGQKGSLVVFWKPVDKPEQQEEDKGRRFILRSSVVFNAQQVDGFEQPETVKTWTASAAEKLTRAAGVEVRFGGGRAYYHPRLDFVQMPHFSDFTNAQGFQSTLLHEAAHWTGHGSRLDRQFGKRFGDEAYAFEELVAELSAAFLCADLGVSNEPRDDHAEYVASWLKVLKNDSRAIFSAASEAQKVVGFLANFQESENNSKKVA